MAFVVPGTLRDSIFVLEGLLEQQTGLNLVEIMTDTAGSSDIILACSGYSGYQFSSSGRMQVGDILSGADKIAHYGALNELVWDVLNFQK